MEFKKIEDDMGLVDVNITTASEYVAEIERGIRLIKERSRCVVKTLPFVSYTNRSWNSDLDHYVHLD